MEFFKIVDVRSSEEEIQEKTGLENLEKISNLMFPLELKSNTEAMIGGIWGEFTLHRIDIKGGVRFALLDCPNALAWTVTTGYPPERKAVVVHLTINRTRKHPDFTDEVNEFLEDHSSTIKDYLTDSPTH